MEKLKVKIREFVFDLKGRKVLVLHHTDVDGICSAVLFKKLAPEANYEFKPVTPLFSKFKGSYERLVFLDISGDQHYSKFEQPTLIIDHHTLFRKKIKNALIVKPQLFSEISPQKYPTAKMVYDLLDAPEELAWLAVLGIIGDISVEQWRGFVSKVLAQQRVSERMAELAVQMIESGRQIGKKEVLEVMKVVGSSQSIRDILHSNLRKTHEKIKQKYCSVLKEFEEVKEEVGDVLMFELKSKYHLGSQLSTEVSFKYPEKIIFVYRKSGDYYVINVRHQGGKYKVNELLERVVKGLPKAVAGGHPAAAGAAVKTKYFEEFKNQFLDWVNRKNKNLLKPA